MAGYSNIRQGLASIEALERELNLKQLQVNRLLNITQAINNNVSADGLFEMYSSFLSWEMGVKKMALFFRQEGKWTCTASIGIQKELLKMDITDRLPQYTRLNNVEDSEHPLVKQFDVVIPVRHKDTPLAYAFIGGFGEEDDMYNKVQFITTISNIVAVAIENKRLFKKQLQQERLNREMELACEMQQMLIPRTLPSCKHYELASIYKPHWNVGGDYYDFIETDDEKIAFCIGDISGKGVAAALLMANFQANFHSLINQYSDLTVFIKELNQAVLRITKAERFITFFVAEFNMKTRTLRYVNAGHNPPALARNGKLQRLKKGCTILGTFEKLPEIEAGEIQIEGEALILLFTDGLTDIKNEKGEFLNQEYGQKFILDNYDLPAKAFNEKMMQEIEAFKGKLKFPDDFTVLTCKIF